jgi:hypothetical protein
MKRTVDPLDDLRAALKPVLDMLPETLLGHQLEERVVRELGAVDSTFRVIDRVMGIERP